MLESLGIKRLESVHYYVHDLERSRRFYTEVMDFAEIGSSSEELTRAGRQRSTAFMAGNCVVVCMEPQGEGGRASRWLRKYPDGVGTLNFEVEDAEQAFRLLEGRGGTPIDDVRRFQDAGGGELACFSIATPFGDTTFRFIERRGFRALYPGFVELETPRGGQNRLGFVGLDHTTSNFSTLGHVSLWLEHVMGFERFWEIQFHTNDVDPAHQHGSGLRSLVYWDPRSGVKFANNEPWRPNYRASQINVFCEELRGPGVQHLAISVKDIIDCVRQLRARGLAFMPTPGTYYDALPERIRRLGIGRIDEDIAVLRELGILVDGDGPGKYLLQIFLKESSGLYHEEQAGPFFFEIIQRKGDQGFGAGNFRALFESIERAQQLQLSGDARLTVPIDPLVLRQTTAFQLLDDDELAELTAHVDERTFPAGQVIFHAGEPGGAMHVVLSGKVEVFLVDEDRKRVVLNELGPGEIFGELSLFDGDPRSASVRALEPTRTFLIDRADLERLFAHRPHAALEVLTVMSRRLRRTDLLLSQRVARNPNDVLEEKQTFGEHVADGVARFGGSWSFIFAFATILLTWVGANTVLLFGRKEPFDPYPFILLNLFLSMLAAIQAPVIMMSQNRQDTKDRVRSELDYQVNLKAELEIMELHEKFDRLEQRIEETRRTTAR